MTRRLASLTRIVPAALNAGADALVSFIFWADSRVNARLTPAWSGWAPACDPSSAPVPTREDAGNAASRVLLSWPSPDADPVDMDGAPL